MDETGDSVQQLKDGDRIGWAIERTLMPAQYKPIKIWHMYMTSPRLDTPIIENESIASDRAYKFVSKNLDDKIEEFKARLSAAREQSINKRE